MKMIKGKPCFNLLDNIMFVVMKNKKKYILSHFYSKIYIYYAKNNTWKADNKTMGCVALF